MSCEKKCSDTQEPRWADPVLGDWLYLGGAEDAKNLAQIRSHHISTALILWN